MKKNYKYWIIATIALIFVQIIVSSCKEEIKTTPIITTTEITSITSSNATSGGNVTSDGGADIIERGICFSTDYEPTIANDTVLAEGMMGAFTSNITGLEAGSTYYVRAYAINFFGTAYGAQVSFTTNGIGSPVIDVDGNTYSTIWIGGMNWMSENLKTTKYSNNDPITYSSSWYNSDAYCWLDDDIVNKTTYGALYNYFTVVDPRNLCPTGWHVPTDAEWTTLTTYLGGEDIAGGKLKDITLWKSPNIGATNSSSFNALPGSSLQYNGFGGVTGFSGFWWSSTGITSNESDKLLRILRYNSSAIERVSWDKRLGFSVRCLKNL